MLTQVQTHAPDLMTSLTSCHFSFSDLYRAAYHSSPSVRFTIDFNYLTQTQINGWVEQVCQIAGWASQMRRGSDGVFYRAFAPQHHMIV